MPEHLHQQPLETVEGARTRIWGALPEASKADLGQFFTPAPLARLIASRANFGAPPRAEVLRILDPGAGVGSLGVALLERLATLHFDRPIHLTAVELDPTVGEALRETAKATLEWAEEAGLALSYEVVIADFVEWAAEALGQPGSTPPFDLVVMNPPYTKISSRGKHRRLTADAGCEVTNLYAAFVALGLELLREGGRLVAITPRSFTNGTYFRPFRQFLMDRAAFESVDVFESRSSLFRDSDVLQENVVFSLVRGRDLVRAVQLYFHGADGHVETAATRHSNLVSPDDPELFIFLRNGKEDRETALRVNGLPCHLEDLGLSVSTGRVVAFRSKDDLRIEFSPQSAPLLYPHHLRGGKVTWPIESKKPNAINVNDGTRSMLFPAGHYVAVKRFSTKEERRRVVPTWVDAAIFRSDHVAFENHLNVFHSEGSGMNRDLAVGLMLFLGSTVVDEYLRQFSGHTQVNATDLRFLRYPCAPALESMGTIVRDPGALEQSEIDAIVNDELWSTT